MRLRPAVCLFAASAALLLSTPVVAFELPGRRLQGLADTQVKRLQNGELHVEAIQETEYEWHWFDLLLNETTWVNMTYSETINYNALIEVDAMSSVTVSGELKWAELDVMIFDGEIRYDEDLVLLCWFNEECPDDAYYARYKGAPRVTNAFGFNRTAVGGLRSPPLTRVVVGVRNHLVLEPITFSIRLLQLPRVIDGNFDVNSSLAPCAVRTDELANDDHRDVTAPARRTEACRQFYTVDMGAYDILQVRLKRTGNLTLGNGESTGQGFAGALYVGEPPTMLTPPPAAYETRKVITNTTDDVQVFEEYFCIDGANKPAGLYTIAIVAAAGKRLPARRSRPTSPTLTRPPTFSPYRRRHAHRPQPRATAPPLPPLTPRTAPPPQACRAAYARVSPPRNARRGAGPNPTVSRRRLRRGFASHCLRWRRRANPRAKRWRATCRRPASFGPTAATKPSCAPPRGGRTNGTRRATATRGASSR